MYPRQRVGSLRLSRSLWGTSIQLRGASNVPGSSWVPFYESMRLGGVLFLHVYDPGSYPLSHIVRIQPVHQHWFVLAVGLSEGDHIRVVRSQLLEPSLESAR